MTLYCSYLHQPNNRSEGFPTSPTRSRKPCLRPGSPLAQQLVTAPRAANYDQGLARPTISVIAAASSKTTRIHTIEGMALSSLHMVHAKQISSSRTLRILGSWWPQPCDIDWPTRRQRQHLGTPVSCSESPLWESMMPTIGLFNSWVRFGKQDENMIGESLALLMHQLCHD